MMHYSLFCVPAINNKSKVVLGIYNQDLFYQGFFIPVTLNCIITQEYWQNLKQERKVTNKQWHIIIVSIKTTTTTTTSLFQIKYSLQSLCPQLAKAIRRRVQEKKENCINIYIC